VHGADRDRARGEVAVVERGGDQVALAQRGGELLDPAVAAGERGEIGGREAGGELRGQPVDGGGELVAAIGEARRASARARTGGCGRGRARRCRRRDRRPREARIRSAWARICAVVR
jgi:hypothetical protein